MDNCVQKSKFVYPVARREESIVDDYHGHKVKNAFRQCEVRKCNRR